MMLIGFSTVGCGGGVADSDNDVWCESFNRMSAIAMVGSVDPGELADLSQDEAEEVTEAVVRNAPSDIASDVETWAAGLVPEGAMSRSQAEEAFFESARTVVGWALEHCDRLDDEVRRFLEASVLSE